MAIEPDSCLIVVTGAVPGPGLFGAGHNRLSINPDHHGSTAQPALDRLTRTLPVGSRAYRPDNGRRPCRTAMSRDTDRQIVLAWPWCMRLRRYDIPARRSASPGTRRVRPRCSEAKGTYCARWRTMSIRRRMPTRKIVQRSCSVEGPSSGLLRACPSGRNAGIPRKR
jgi:hypothetical protein